MEPMSHLTVIYYPMEPIVTCQLVYVSCTYTCAAQCRQYIFHSLIQLFYLATSLISGCCNSSLAYREHIIIKKLMKVVNIFYPA